MGISTFSTKWVIIKNALVYLDDIIIFSSTFEDHLERLEFFLCRLKEAALKVKGSKCSFIPKKFQFLGHIVSNNGVEFNLEKINAERHMKDPQNPHMKDPQYQTTAGGIRTHWVLPRV